MSLHKSSGVLSTFDNKLIQKVPEDTSKLDVDQIQDLIEDLEEWSSSMKELSTSDLLALNLSETQMQIIAQTCIDHLQQHGTIMVKLLKWLDDQGFDSSKHLLPTVLTGLITSPQKLSTDSDFCHKVKPTSATPVDCLEIMSSDKVLSATTIKQHYTIPQLHQ